MSGGDVNAGEMPERTAERETLEKRLVACEQARTDNRTRYVQLGRDHNTLGSDKGP